VSFKYLLLCGRSCEFDCGCGTDTTPRSGELNAKHRELLELQALAQRRLAGARMNFADGMKAAKEVQRDLQWTQKRVE
jgi:hypothetical protein